MDKLEQLHELREKAGITFTKSFNCKEAEKNIHLVDKDKFFEKFIKKLDTLGYLPSKDFTFDIIRHKYPYAERHHIGKTYEWKYFYSTTFDIPQELISFLEQHLFIKKKDGVGVTKEELKLKRLNKIKKLEDKKLLYQSKIKKFNNLIKSAIETNNTVSVENYKRAVQNTYEKIKNIDEQLSNLYEKEGQ